MEGETLGRKEAKERFYPRGMKERMVHGCSWAAIRFEHDERDDSTIIIVNMLSACLDNLQPCACRINNIFRLF